MSTFLKNNRWIRLCPECKCEISHPNKYYATYANKHKHLCVSCKTAGVRHPLYGKHMSEQSKQKMKDNMPSFVGANNHAWGTKGMFYGRHHTSESKKLMRIIRCIGLKNKDIIPKTDKGASEWFSMMNVLGYNFKENYYCKGIGYFADGYDQEKHIWMEYDSPSHRAKRYRISDPIRQRNIIEHFISIGKPLNQFVRVDCKEKDRMGVSVEYRG